jgi:acetyl esterase/lipase
MNWQLTKKAGASDRVQAVADWFGPVDVTQSPPTIVFSDDPCTWGFSRLSDQYGGEATPYFYWTFAWSAFLGGSLADPSVLRRAARATPLSYVDPEDPPFLIIHGDADGMVPIEQSELLVAALNEASVEVTFVRLPGGGHGFAGPPDTGPDVSPDYLNPTVAFFDGLLK